MKKYLSVFLALIMLGSIFSSNTSLAASSSPFNQPYTGWKYGKQGDFLSGIIPALGSGVEQRPWKLAQWSAIYKFPNSKAVTQINYDVFNIKKKFASDDFNKEDGFGLIQKSDDSIKAFFEMVMKDNSKNIASRQLDYYREYIIQRSNDGNLKVGHPTYFNVNNKDFLHVPGVIQWMGGKFDKVEKISEDSKIGHFLLSEWPQVSVNTKGCPITVDYKAYGYTERNIRVVATAKGAFPDLSNVVSLTGDKLINTKKEVFAGTASGDCETLRNKFGDEIDIVIDDGYGRTVIETVTLPKPINNKVDFVPTKLNLTDSGQLWMTFKFDGETNLKSSSIQHADGMPMLAQVKIGGAITTEFDMGLMFKQLPAELKPGSTYNVLLGKIDVGTKPGKYYFKITGVVNNPNHSKRAKESPTEAYKNNEIKGEWVREIKQDEHDLIAISVAASPSNMTEKQTTTIKADVKNLGPTAQKDVRIRFFSNGKQIYEVKKDMPANKTIQVGGFTYKPGAAGAYSISVHVDPLAEKKDKNRTNNIATTGCIVTNGDVTGNCSSPDTVRGDWNVTYSLITGYKVKTGYYTWTDSEGRQHTSSYTYTDYNDPIWSNQKVPYKETLQVKGSINTKQGIATDPKKPRESDRESRGSWEIIPWAKQKGINANEVTRAGYGFELKFETTYDTDWETKVPKGYENTAKPIGTKPSGVKEATAKIYNSAGKYVTTLTLDKTSDNGKKAVFELPLKSYTDPVTKKKYRERKFFTDHKAPDGKYRIEVQTGPAGLTGISSCKTFYVTIYGSMYDDVQNLGTN